jgi:photosystem II stability/assembly factor-like uncharacterized protein
MKRLLLSGYLLVIFYPLCAQWQTIHPKTTFNQFFARAVMPRNTSLYYALGNTMGISADGGYTWSAQAINGLPVHITAATRYYDIVFPSEQVGYFLHQNQVYKTTDRGASWQKVLDIKQSHTHYMASAFFSALYFINDDHGFAVGEFQKIFHTSDGGLTWQTLSWSNDTAPYISYSDVEFLDANTGFISGYEVDNISTNFGFTEFVMKTTDGGEHWTRVEVPTDLENREVKLQFVNSDVGFARVTRSQYGDDLFVTTNGGKSWEKNSLDSLRDIHAAYFVDEKIGFMYGRDFKYTMKLFRTDDQGKSWENIAIPVFSGQDENIITDIKFSDHTHGYAVGSAGNILTTQDGGKTWNVRNRGYPFFYASDFTDDKNGYASSGKGFFKTTDGGNSWQYAEGSDSLAILDMDFKNSDDGIFYGFRDSYFHVKDGATKIEPIELPVNFMSLSEAIVEGDSLFVSGTTLAPSGNVLLKSGDRGKNWQVLPIHEEDDFIVELNRIGSKFYLGTTQSILHSGNGESWQQVKSFSFEYLECMTFATEQVGFASIGGKVMRTHDGGINWYEVGTFPKNILIHKFLVADSKVVFAYGAKYIEGAYYGAIWKSINFGMTWTEESLPVLVDEAIADMSIVGKHVFAVGGFGQVFRTELTEVITDVEGHSFSSLAIFPVPASRYLNFEIPEDEVAEQIYLYDLQGNALNVLYEKDESRYQLDLAGHTQGLYILYVATNKNQYRQKVVKTN